MRPKRWGSVAVLLALAGCAGGPVRSSAPTPGCEGVTYCLPRTLLEITVTVAEQPESTSQPAQFTVSVAVIPHVVADPRREFVLSRDASAFSADEITVGVGASGLLTSLETKSTEASLDLARGVVDAAVAAVKLGSLASTGGLPLGAPAPTELDAESLARRQVDDLVTDQLRRLVGTHRRFWALPDRGPLRAEFADFPATEWTLAVALARADEAGAVSATTAPGEAATAPPTPVEGVYVRGVEPYVASANLTWSLELPAGPDAEAVRMDLEAAAAATLETAEHSHRSAEYELAARRAYAGGPPGQDPSADALLRAAGAAADAAAAARKSATDAEAEGAPAEQVAALRKAADDAETKATEALARASAEGPPAELVTAAVRAAQTRAARERAERDLRAVEQRQKAWAERMGRAWRTAAERLGFRRTDAGFRADHVTRLETRVAVADFAPVTRISFRRAQFVKSTDDVTFTEGVVTKHTWNRPSPVAAVAGFPAEVIGKLISLPGEIVKLKFDLATSRTQLESQEAALAAAEGQAATQRRTDEAAYWDAVARAGEARRVWDAAVQAGADATVIEAARSAFVTAAITANAAARKTGRDVPYPDLEKP